MLRFFFYSYYKKDQFILYFCAYNVAIKVNLKQIFNSY